MLRAALENVVQHNVPGPAGNGLSVTGADPADPSTLVSRGNIVRFAGGRGLSIASVHDREGRHLATLTQECLMAYAG